MRSLSLTFLDHLFSFCVVRVVLYTFPLATQKEFFLKIFDKSRSWLLHRARNLLAFVSFFYFYSEWHQNRWGKVCGIRWNRLSYSFLLCTFINFINLFNRIYIQENSYFSERLQSFWHRNMTNTQFKYCLTTTNEIFESFFRFYL